MNLSEKEIEQINVFKETYNAMYLKGLSVRKLKFIKSISNPVQKRLIENLSIKKSYDVKHIEGPIGVRKYNLISNGKPDKTIYLFGETHFNTEGQCEPYPSIEFVEYIKRLSKETTSFFDIYVETSIVKSTIKNNKSMIVFRNTVKAMFKKRIKFITAYNLKKNKKLTTSTGYMFKKLENEFKECIEPQSRLNNSNCELFRFHYVDIRSTWDTLVSPCDNYNEDVCLHMIYIVFDTGLKQGKNADEIMDVIRRINKHCPSILNGLKILLKNRLNLIDIFCKSKKFKNELNNSYKKDKIISFLKGIVLKKIDDIDEFIEGIKSLISSIENKTEVNIEFIKKYVKVFLKLNDLLLDVYCLSRIFKKHNVTDTFQPVESKNIIIYAGNAHSRNMAEFISYIGFQPTYSFYNDEDKSCVNMKKSNKYMPLKSPMIMNPISLKKLTVIQLKSLTKKLKLKGYSKLKKDELIYLIQSFLSQA